MMETTFAKTLDSLAKIPEGTYEGFFWMSDKERPRKIPGEASLSELRGISGNPFVVEGLLYDRQAERSIHIMHTGRYQITCFDWREFDESKMVSDKDDKATYLPQKIEGVTGLNFQRVWIKKSDPLCDEKKVLKIYATVFIGFKTT